MRVLCELLRHGNLEPGTATLLREREQVLEETILLGLSIKGLKAQTKQLRNFFKKVLAFISCIVYNNFCCDVDSYEA